MKFSIGDKVILKQTEEEGTITDFLGGDILEVEVNQVRFPVYTDEVDHPYLKWFTKSAKKSTKTNLAEDLPAPEKGNKPRVVSGIYLSFMPVWETAAFEDVVHHFKVFLLNETPQAIGFKYDVQNGQRSLFQHEGSLHPFGNLYLHNVSFLEMSESPRFHWQLEDLQNSKSQKENGVLRIKPKKLVKEIHHVMQHAMATFSYLLLKEFKIASPSLFHAFPAAPLPSPGKHSTVKSLQDLPGLELDLHIEKLLPEHRGLSGSAILEIQLNALEKRLHDAIAFRQERLIIIHGLGKGALREAVHQMLRQFAEVRTFKNEYMAQYGYGATEVFLRLR